MEEADVDRRSSDQPQGVQSPSLSLEDEAIIVAFRKHTLLPLDDSLYALQATIPHLTRSSLRRAVSSPLHQFTKGLHFEAKWG